MRSSVRGAAWLGMILLVLVACGGGGSSSVTDAAILARPSSTAQLMVVSPKNGQVFNAASGVPVKVMLHDGRIVPATTLNVVPDEGHLHVSVDGEIVAMNFGLSDRLTGIAPGIHVLQVEFVASDHLSFDPRVIEQVTFEVRK